MAEIGKGYTFANITYHNEFPNRPTLQLAYCPHCEQLMDWKATAGNLAIVKCRNCHRQFPARDGQVVDPGPCDFACGYAEPYGFVPEAGCPVHDLANAND